MALKPFDENTLCEKCGGRDISMTYCNIMHQAGEYFAEPVTTEHMHRQCARCGYQWLETTLDATLPAGTDAASR